MVPIVHSRGYDITAFGLERLHAFESRNYRRIRDCLVRQGLRDKWLGASVGGPEPLPSSPSDTRPVGLGHGDRRRRRRA